MTEETTPSPDSNLADHRECLACGYDLHGLGDGPRCPECGLLNIPQEYRQHVWDLVDSGKWFFSGFLHPFKKRLPGWWWALDRDGDLQKSYKFAAKNFIIASLIVLFSCYFANACVLKFVTRAMVLDQDDPSATWIEYGNHTSLNGIALLRHKEFRQSNVNDLPGTNPTMNVLRSRHLAYIPTWHGFAYSLGFISWLLFIWGLPTFVGLVTQLRKGLSQYARPQRTVLAACMYEFHRLIYIACVISVLLVFEAIVRYYVYGSISASPDMTYRTYLWLFTGILMIFGGIGWIGPLRSDYTKQLVRSRRHTLRIIIMYAIILPAMFVLAYISLTYPFTFDYKLRM